MLTVEQIAGITHELNSEYCHVLGDDSHRTWDDAAPSLRNSVIAGVRFQLANPECSARESHEAWMAFKLSDGWVFGAKKDAEEKTHPALESWDSLPLEDQIKDVLFVQTVRALVPLLNEGEAAGADE